MLDGPLEDAPNDEVPSMAWLHMAHTGPLPPIWDYLDLQPSADTLHLLSLVEFTDLLNGCAPDALVRNAFVILRMVATAHYLHHKSQELHEALMEAHGTLGEDADERVRLCEEGPAIAANAQRVLHLTDQLAAMSNQHQEASRSHVQARVRCADLHVVDGPAIHHGDRPAIHDLQSHGTGASPRLEGGLGGLPHP